MQALKKSQLKEALGPVSQTQDWNQCLRRVGETRNREDFGLLFEHFSPRLKSFLMRAGSLPEQQAEELVQETMIKVWHRAPTYVPGQASASTWIYTIARNTRIDWLRKQLRENSDSLRADDIYDTDQDTSPHSTLVQWRRDEHLGAKIAELPAEQAEVLRLMYGRGLSGQEISQALEMPLGTVKSRLRLALAKLKTGIAPAFAAENE